MVIEAKKRTVGLALSGGGARGFAYVGALKVLAEAGIDFDLYTGTSAGSIIAGALASGMSSDEIAAMAGATGYLTAARPTIGRGGMLSNAPLGNFLRRHFPATQFEEMPKPFAAVAFDLEEGEEAILTGEGDAVQAIQASCAVPGVFLPIRMADGRLLIDGGVSTPMPTRVAREMGADIVIGIDVISCGSAFRSKYLTSVGILAQSGLSLLRAASMGSHHFADIVIEPAVSHLRPDQISRREEFIELGVAAAEAKIDEIKALLAG
jgi:NTE family protein